MKKQQAISLAFQLSVLFWLGQISVIIFSWRYLPPQIPLFYSRPWGKEQLADPVGLFILPCLSLLVSLVNLILLITLFKKERLISQILAISMAAFNLLCLITLVEIMRLVI